MDAVTYFLIVLAAIVLGLNAFALYLRNRLSELVFMKSDEEGALIGDHVGRLYTQYLFGQVMAGKFPVAPRMMAIGNPERDKVIRAVKASDEYARIRLLANCIPPLPVIFVG